MADSIKKFSVTDKLTFGVYKGKLVGEVIEEDPEYMGRLVAVNKHAQLDKEAENYLKQHLE